MKRLNVLLLAALIGLFVFAYLVSYLYLSRRGFTEADRANAIGFYFFFPEPESEKRKNDFCNFIYYPLIQIDVAIGTGRAPACDPLLRFE